VKTLIKSENSALMYLKTRPYNKLYRARDFLFLRHAFQKSNKTFIIDKSIDNISFPPFTTIVRGELCIVWGIVKEPNAWMLVGDIAMNN
jgi:hypothetical protein